MKITKWQKIASLLFCGISLVFGALMINTPISVKAMEQDATALVEGHTIIYSGEKFASYALEDVHLGSEEIFTAENADSSMFGNINIGRNAYGYEIEYDVEVITPASGWYQFGFGLKNIGHETKKYLIQNGGYQFVFGRSGVTEISSGADTITLMKNSIRDNNSPATVPVKYTQSTIPEWLDMFTAGYEFSIVTGAAVISDGENDCGFYVYMKVFDENHEAVTLVDMYDYTDVMSDDFGSYATGIVNASEQSYRIYTKNGKKTRTMAEVKSYDILQLYNGKDNLNTKENNPMFDNVSAIYDEDIEVNYALTVNKDMATNTWNNLSFGLRNCPNGSTSFLVYNGGYRFSFGNESSLTNGNNAETVVIARNGLYTGKEYPVNAYRMGVMPSWFFTSLHTKGYSCQLTLGVTRLLNGEEAVGCYAYIKVTDDTHTDELVFDFYDYYDYASQVDYFGHILSGNIENSGEYYITTCGDINKEYQTLENVGLSDLIPFKNDIVYTSDGVIEVNEKEKVIGRYLSGTESYHVKLGATFVGGSILTLSLAGADETLENGLLFTIDQKENSVSIQGMGDGGIIAFDSGKLSCSSSGIQLTEGQNHEIEYGLQKYRYEGESVYSRVKIFFAIDGVVLFNQNYDFATNLALGYFTGGFVSGSKDATVTLSALEENTITTVVTARALKESVVVGEKSALAHVSSTPYGATSVEYIFTEGADIATINEYGVIVATKAGIIKAKVHLSTPYGEFESNEVTIQVTEGEEREDVLAQQAQEQSGCGSTVASQILPIMILYMIPVIVCKYNRKQKN